MKHFMASYPLLTEVLREEWGFTGSIISDMTHHGNSNVNFNCYENIHNRILAGCNNQLDSSSFSDNLKVSWDSTQHCPVYGTAKTPTYSFWYAVRKSVKETLYMVLRCGAMTKNTVVTQADMSFSGTIDNVYTGKFGEAVNIEIALGEDFEVGSTYNGKEIVGVTYEIDAYTPLPAGLALEDNKIVGTSEVECNQFVRVLGTLELEDGTTAKVGNSFELFVTRNYSSSALVSATANAGLPAGAIIGLCGGGVVVIAAAVLVVLLVLKKKIGRAHV